VVTTDFLEFVFLFISLKQVEFSHQVKRACRDCREKMVFYFIFEKETLFPLGLPGLPGQKGEPTNIVLRPGQPGYPG
jgi:hypothetical protein